MEIFRKMEARAVNTIKYNGVYYLPSESLEMTTEDAYKYAERGVVSVKGGNEKQEITKVNVDKIVKNNKGKK